MHRGGAFPCLRAVTNVIMRDAPCADIDDMYRGRRVAYMDYLGYDEVAHHAGHDTEDARAACAASTATWPPSRTPPPGAAALRARRALRPRPEHRLTFQQRYGLSLGDLVQQLIARGSRREPHRRRGGGDEGWGHLNALLTEIVRTEGVTGRGAKRLLQGRQEAPAGEDAAGARRAVVALGPEARDRHTAGDAGVVVCPSGNLANVYFTREPGRLTLEYLVATYPGLVEGLASPPGDRLRLVLSEARGHVVLGPKGYRDLDSGTVGARTPWRPSAPTWRRSCCASPATPTWATCWSTPSTTRPRERWPPSRS